MKYHFKTDQGIDFLTQSDEDRLAGARRLSHSRPLHQHYTSIANGQAPSWTLRVQIMPYEDAASYRFNPFDLTKVWPHGDYSLQTVGRLVLDRNPDNYFTQIEQAAFEPTNLVPGIAASASRRTRCCSDGCSPTPTRIVTGSAPTMRSCRSTSRTRR